MNQPKTALIAGASGQVGSFLLDLLLESETYTEVISIGRKLLDKQHPKLKQFVVDFTYESQLQFKADDVFCCLGTTIKKAGNQANFKQVDFAFPLHLAQQTFAMGTQKFLVITAMGADKNSRIFYSRTKGELEEALKSIGFSTLGIFKPSMLLGPREEFRLGELIGKAAMQALAPLIPAKYKGVQAAVVAKSMLLFAQSDQSGIHEIENDKILSM